VRRPRKRSAQNHERWLVSYADFVTLLFAFFVVLYSSSQVDKRRVGQLALAIQVAFQNMGVFQASTTQVPVDSRQPMPFNSVQAIENNPGTTDLGHIVSPPEGPLSGSPETEDLTALKRELQETLSLQIQRKEVEIRSAREGLVISLREIGFFDSGSAQLKPGSRPAFSRMATILARGNYRMRIEGHTDKIPVHNAQFASNWELSTARATGLVQLFILQYRFAPARLSAAGYAEYHPVTTNATAEGRAQNRRVDLVVLGKPPQ
jgi:chemotaxis protein MotB